MIANGFHLLEWLSHGDRDVAAASATLGGDAESSGKL